MANLVNTYSANLTSSEESFILDCDDLNTAESLIRALRQWGNLSVSELEDLTVGLFEERINAQERQILENVWGAPFYRIALWLYILDGSDAEQYTAFNFSANQINGQTASTCAWCIGNAFKHAIFRVLNAATFTRQISINLGVAHELNAPIANIVKDTEMDTYNNAQGIAVFDGRLSEWLGCSLMCKPQLLGSWIQDINQRISNGQLQYLIIDPTHAGDVNFDKKVWTDEAGNSRF